MRLKQALERLHHFSGQMDLKQDLVEAAERYYKLAFNREFIQGRSVDSVAAVCLYIACRVQKSPYLLIDFADCTQIDMYRLGQVYMQLV